MAVSALVVPMAASIPASDALATPEQASSAASRPARQAVASTRLRASEVTFANTAKARPGRAAELRRRLATYARESRRERGCLDYRWFEARDRPGEFRSLERFESAAAARRHVEASHSRALLALEKTDPTMASPPVQNEVVELR